MKAGTDAWLLAAGGAATLLAMAFLLGLLQRTRRAGSLRLGRAPVLPVPVFDLLALVAVLLLAMGQLGGLWFGVAAAGGVMLLLRINGVPLKRHFGPGPLTVPQAVGLALAIALAVYLPLQMLSDGIEGAFHRFGWPTPVEPAVDLFLGARGWRQLAPILLAAIVCAPLGEEALFRGLIQPVLRRRLPPGAAIAATALLFAALHGHGISFVPLLLFGAVLGLAYELTGSLLVCILVHFWFNFFTALLLLGGYGPSAP
jgi:membrane protease YdiL (CAAX protease family)